MNEHHNCANCRHLKVIEQRGYGYGIWTQMNDRYYCERLKKDVKIWENHNCLWWGV